MSKSNSRTDTDRFVVGVNYWPSGIGPDLWKHFDVDAVEEDFAQLSDLGITLVRVYLLWEDFQPKPDSLCCSALAHLLSLCDAAAAEHLKLELMFFSGHLGDINRVPTWLTDAENPSQIRERFSDPQARRAALRLVRGVANSVGGHPALAAYNLGNQPGLLATPQSLTQSYDWFTELRAAIFEIDPHHPVTCSLSGRNLDPGAGLRVDRVFENLDFCTIESEGLPFPVKEPQKAQQSLFSCALTMALSNKPTMLQEWNPPYARNGDSVPKDDEVARYAETLLPQLVELGARGAILWWFTDTQQSGLPGLNNRLYGLFDNNGELRPHGKVLSDFARQQPRVKPNPTNSRRVKLSVEQFYAAAHPQLQELFEEFVRD